MKKMNKKTRGLLIGVLVVVLLAVVTVVLLLTGNQGEDTSSSSSTAQTETYPLIEANIEDFTSLKVTNGEGTYTILPGSEADTFTVEELTGYEQDSSTAKSTVSGLTALNATNKVMDTVENKADYGLETPSATAEVVFGDQSYTIYLGEEAASNAGYYAMMEGDDALYTISSTVAKTLLNRSLDYASKAMTPSIDTSDAESIPNMTYLNIQRPDLEQPITLETNPNVEEGMFNSSYRMVSPIESEIDYQADETYVWSMFGLSAARVTDFYDEANAAAYGFDQPAATIDMTYDNINVHMVIGDLVPDDDSYRYVLFNDRGLVFEVAADSLPLVTVQADDLISSLGILPAMVDLSSVDFVLKGETYTFEITNTEVEEEEDESTTSESEPQLETTKVVCNGQEVDVDQFKNFYQLMIYPQIENINTDPVSVEPTVEMRFNYADGSKTESMEFYEVGDSRRIQIAINGDLKFEARSGFITKLETELQHLLAGEEVGTEW
ncbi:MAG: DUF4340 domain-containing protein [Massiliimalia sp.]|jgi:hypothetical protein